jgi:hypothetical protein
MWKRLLLSILIFNPFVTGLLTAQQAPSATEALSLFRAGKYAEAASMYEKLLERSNRDINYNYYYGVSLVKLKQKNDQAIQRLKLAATRPPSPDVHFYLGHLYQHVYEPELAIEHYERFLKLQKTKDSLTTLAEQGIEESKAANLLINKYFDIKILRKDTIKKDDLINYYSLSKDGGQLMKAGDFFRVGVNPNQVIFRTERGNEVLFPILGSNGTHNIHKVIRLLDSWTDAEPLAEPISSPYNDIYPFLLIDGTTLYFSSDRSGGMGGLDIYQSFYDPISGTFSEPANMGPPFNSPDDDFLLVPDIYAGKAWFATNRGITGDSVVVTELVWDNNVVRNFTENINQIKTLAMLPVSKDAAPRTSSTTFAGNDRPVAVKKEDFRFTVNDTLVYTRNEQFVSSEALELFKTGRKAELKKDSLLNQMNSMRRAYSVSYDQKELLRLIDEIVKLEKETYGLEEEINRNYLNARRRELDRIRQLQREGRYIPVTGTAPTRTSIAATANQKALDNLKKSDLTFYSDEEFLKKKELLDEMYRHFFNQRQTQELQRSDSLYVWANILTLESARILERTWNMPAPTQTVRERINSIRQKDGDEENPELRAMIQQSREYKKWSLDLYEQALDQKFAIYYPVAMEFSGSSNRVGTEDMLIQAVNHIREADDRIKSMPTYNAENLERHLALKRRGVDMLEESMVIQLAGAPMPSSRAQTEGTRFTDISGSVQPSYPAIHRGSEINARNTVNNPSPQEVNPAALVSAAFSQSGRERDDEILPVSPTQQPSHVVQQIAATTQTPKPEYRVQIGVFRNEPNATAIAKIPAVTKTLIPESGLYRYYSGSWKTHADAQAMVASIRDAGFPGAFVVAFLNSETINIDKAKTLE